MMFVTQLLLPIVATHGAVYTIQIESQLPWLLIIRNVNVYQQNTSNCRPLDDDDDDGGRMYLDWNTNLIHTMGWFVQ